MKKIILDTNALMAIAEFKLDLFAELDRFCDFSYKIYLLEDTLKELTKIMQEQRGKYKWAAKLALALVQAKNIPLLNSKEKTVDDDLVQHSQQGDLVLTLDAVLKKRLTKPYLTLRNKKHIILVR